MPGKFMGNRWGRNQLLEKRGGREVSRKETFELHFLEKRNSLSGSRRKVGMKALKGEKTT